MSFSGELLVGLCIRFIDCQRLEMVSKADA